MLSLFKQSSISNFATVSYVVRCLSGATEDIFGKIRYKYKFNLKTRRRHGMDKNKPKIYGSSHFKDKPIQNWDDWDGFGAYKYRHHDYPNNITLRDVQRRRILAKHAEDRLHLNAIRKAEGILPKELSMDADEEIQKKVPRDSAITRINRRCTITGKPRGIFHQFRVSRFIFRHEADYNRVSGAERARWMYGIDIKP